jgi:argininosuccinate synthase
MYDDITAADLVIETGEVIYGKGRWKRPLADRLSVPPRTVARWLDGTIKLDFQHGIIADLREIIAEENNAARDRIAELRCLISKFKEGL